MIDLKGKKLLVLGGTSSTLELVKEAQKLGVHVTVVDDSETGVSKEIANESYIVSTTDMDNLKKIIEEKEIDGVFTGPSEFNLKNTMKICDILNLPFYVTEKQWDICSNKISFKDLCRSFNVGVVPEYDLTKNCLQEDLDKIKYPVIVKPVDGGGSRGLSICRDEKELKAAIPLALSSSISKKIIVEKYITSDHGFACRYIANDGEIYLTAVNDRYTVDLSGGKAMISSAAIFPSKEIDYFINEINPKIIEMFKSIGIRNGSFFMQALVEDENIFFHEMGLRLSGGLVYKMFEKTCGFSDLEMMIRYALGEKFATKTEINKINPYFNGYYTGSLNIPLREGIIGRISGIDEIKKDSSILDFVQYYNIGDEIISSDIGTLAQHFCRIKLILKNKEEFIEKINRVQDVLELEDEDGNDMVYRYFDTDRLD